VVEDYSRRQLTKSDDKLPALRGLARVMEARTGERYVAGLWASHLLCGILWHRGTDTDGEAQWLRAVEMYRAPSWSWASLDWSIVMPGRPDIESSMLPAKCMLKAIEVSVTPKGTDPHGRLSDGVLRVTGKVQVADARSANPLQWRINVPRSIS
jgi:hypothetical protein